MKGITPVIAIILLLLITISMVGFAFVWFTRVSELATQQTQEQLQKDLERQSQKIRIDVISPGVDASNPMKVVIRNTGSAAIPLKSIVGFKNDVNVDCMTASTDDPADTKFSTAADIVKLNIGSLITCKDGRGATAEKCTTGNKIKITAPGNSDIVACPVIP